MSRGMRWAAVSAAPVTAVPTAQERNRDVNDPASGARSRPRAPVKGSFTSRFLVSMCREKWGDICRLTRAIARRVRVRICRCCSTRFSRAGRARTIESVLVEAAASGPPSMRDSHSGPGRVKGKPTSGRRLRRP